MVMVVNNKPASKPELRRFDEGIFSQKQRHDVCHLHLRNDQVPTSPAHINICGEGQRGEGKGKGREGQIEGKGEGKVERKS